MSYAVKEIYLTRQGEGFHTGRRAVFLRFAGCNLWTGREQDRARAICRFCDTDFLGTDGPRGGHYGCAVDLAKAVRAAWDEGVIESRERHDEARESDLFSPVCYLTEDYFEGTASADDARPYVVCTGGEPLLQLNPRLIEALHAEGFEIAVETNGTRRAPEGIDWICVSPKAGAEINLATGNELKLVYPQQDAPPENFAALRFDHFFLQPMDGPRVHANTRAAEDYCAAHPQWRVSRQMHKAWGIA